MVSELAAAIAAAKDEPKLVAEALSKAGLMHQVLKNTKMGQDIIFSHSKQLAQSLADVWDEDLSTEFKVEVGLTDWQMNEMRFKLCYEWDDERGWKKRVWFKHAITEQVEHFPQPVVAQWRWRPLFIDLCARHKLELLKGGTVAQRGFKEGLALLLTRCDPLLPIPEEVTPENPLVASLGWDALKHAGRHITHGGMKLATFASQAVSTQSELNFVSTNIFRDNDDHFGLIRGLRDWVPALNEAKRAKVFGRTTAPDAPTQGALVVGGEPPRQADGAAESQPEKNAITGLPREHYDVDFAVTLDLSAMRSIANRTKGCATHCECDTGDSNERCGALHDWPEVQGNEKWYAMKRLLSSKCKLLTKERRMSLSHFVRPCHDWRNRATCDSCEWSVDKQQYQKELTEFTRLVETAKTSKTAKKKLDALRKAHRLSHFKAEYMHEDLLEEFDCIEFVMDLMHGMPLNLAKILFKYSFLDALTEPEQREELAEFLIEIDCPFDCRVDSQSGWMRASAMQAFECGSTKSPGLGPNVVKLCDMCYGCEAGAAQGQQQPGPPDSDPPSPPQSPQPQSPLQEPARVTAGNVRRPTRKPGRKPNAPRPRQAQAAAPAAARPATKQATRPSDVDDATWEMLEGRYGEHACIVHAIMKAWESYHELSWLLAQPLEDKSLARRQERACEVAHAAITFAHRFEIVCNGRHHSWYLHNFVYVVPRQIEKYGALWPFSTAALEGRGARIKRIRVCWRSYNAKPMDCKSERAGRVSVFKRSYKSAPTIQIMRMITAAEELYHSGKGRGAARLHQTGRFRKVKIEADHSSMASYEMDPFKALSSFLMDAEVQAGANSA